MYTQPTLPSQYRLATELIKLYLESSKKNNYQKHER